MRRLLILLPLIFALVLPGWTEAAATRIQFAAGATSAVLSTETISANGTKDYSLNVMAGQFVSVQVLANTPLYLAITGAKDGQTLLYSSSQVASWHGKVGKQQDYLIQVVNPGAATTYTLVVTVPVTVTFDALATSHMIVSQMGAKATVDYAIEVTGGQTLNVSIVPGADNGMVVVGVSNADGVRYQSPDALQKGWSGSVPQTQTYLVQLVNTGTTSVSYEVLFGVPAIVRFAPGAISARLAGFAPAYQMSEYLVSAQAGQTMTVTITSPNTLVGLTIYGETDGQPYKRYEIMPLNSWSGQLPSTQVYHILAIPVLDAQATGSTFTLDITIK